MTVQSIGNKLNEAACIGSWLPRAMLPTPRVGLNLIGTSAGLYAIGGRIKRESIGEVESYDVETDTWTMVQLLKQPRSYFATVADEEGVIYVVEGMKHATSILSSTERLDPREVELLP